MKAWWIQLRIQVKLDKYQKCRLNEEPCIIFFRYVVILQFYAQDPNSGIEAIC